MRLKKFFHEKPKKEANDLDANDVKDYEDLIYLSKKREIKTTIEKSTKAGVTAGLMVMSGVVIAGPLGAAVGGTFGTIIATKISRDVVSMHHLLKNTPKDKRSEVLKIFAESLSEGFQESIQENPELKLLLGGGSIFGVVRYMLDKGMIENEQLEKLDAILSKVS